jgi:hypothetical protein
VRVEAEIQVRAVVGDVHLGVLGCRGTFDRIALNELRDPNRLQPHLVVEQTIQGRGCRHTRRRYRVSAPGQPWRLRADLDLTR